MAGKPQHSQVDRAPVSWKFWLWWVLATAFGWGVAVAVGLAVVGAVGLALAVVLGRAVGVSGFLAAAVGLLVGEVMGWAVPDAMIGTMQWLVLRRQVPRAGWWVLATAFGWFVGVPVGLTGVGAVGQPRAEAIGLLVMWPLGGAVAGAVLGVMQWLVLRRRVPRAGWWVLASAVGGAVALAVVGAGAIIGGALVWLLRQPAAPGREAVEQ